MEGNLEFTEALRHRGRQGRFTAFCIPPNGQSLSTDELERGPGDLRQIALASLIGREFNRYSCKRVLSPPVGKSSGWITPSETLSRARLIWNDVTLLQAPKDQTWGADGVSLGINQGFCMSTRGCALIVVTYDDFVIAAHASLASLIDKARIATGKPNRARKGLEGIVQYIAHIFAVKGLDIAKATFDVFFSIHPSEFRYSRTDPVYGAFNTKLYQDLNHTFPGIAMDEETGDIDIAAIATGFAERVGFRDIGYDHVLHSKDGFATKGTQRNLVGLVRHK